MQLAREDLKLISSGAWILPQIHVPRCWNVTHMQFGKFLCWSAQECNQNVSHVVGMSYEYLERSWNEVGMQLEYISFWNAVRNFWAWAKHSNRPQAKNGPEYLECDCVAVGSFKKQLEYPGMDKEFSFQLHFCSFFL